MVRDEHDRRGPWAAARDGRGRARRVSRAPRSRLAAGSSSRSRSGSGISARAIEIRRRSPADSVPYGWSATAPSPSPSRSAARAIAVLVGVDVPPRLGGGVAGGHDEVDRRQVVAQHGLDRAPRRADPPPQLARVDPAVARAEDVDGPGGRPQRQPGDRQQRRLARPVRADDHPALALADRPVERPEDRSPARRTATP